MAFTSACANRGCGPHGRPEGERHDGDANDRGNEEGGRPIGQALNGGTAALGFTDQADNLGQQRLRPDPLRPHDEGSGAVHGGADDLAAGLLLDGQRLAGEHRFVDGAVPLHHRAVDGNLLAGADAELVAGLNFGEGHVFIRTVAAQAAGQLRRQPHQRPQRGARSPPRPQLEHLTEQHQRDDGGRRFEVDADPAGAVAQRRGEGVRRHRGHDAVRVSHRHPKPDQREHVEAAMAQRLGRANQQRPSGPQHDRRGERELDPGARRAGLEGVRPGAREHVAHRHQHQRRRKQQGHPESPLHIDELGIGRLLGGDRLRLQRHAADRAAPGALAHHLRVHRAGPLQLVLRVGGGRYGWLRGQEGARIFLEALAATRVAEDVRGALEGGAQGRALRDHHAADGIPGQLDLG